jgi:ribosomal protein S1
MMKFRNTLIATAAVLALAAAPLYAATLSGKVVGVDENSITVMKDGKTTVYVLPSDLEIQTKDQRTIDLSQLRGQTVTLTVDDQMHGQAQGQREPAQPRVTNIRVDGDLDIDNDVETD